MDDYIEDLLAQNDSDFDDPDIADDFWDEFEDAFEI